MKQRISALIGGWGRHLSDERLFDSYLSEQGGESLDPRTAEHLADCLDCSRRYQEVSGFMTDMRQTADAETDALFTPEALRAQQQEIARRVELLGNSGRVLSFPAHVESSKGSGLETVHRSRVAAGWVGAAAAAGLFIGVGAGIFYDMHARPADRTASSPAISAPAANQTPTQVNAPPSDPTPSWLSEDEAAELEVSLDRPRTPELMALDLITPHVREIKYRR